MVLSDLELLHWLARWGHTPRLELAAGDGPPQALEFHGEVAELTPHLENGEQELAFTHRLTVPGGKAYPLSEVRFFNRHPPLALVGRTFYLLRNAPPPQVLEHWASAAGGAGAQAEPSPADAPAQDAVEPRRGLGAALRRAPGEAAVHLRAARRDGAPAAAGQEPARPKPLALERPRMAVARGQEAPASREQAGDSGRPAPGAGDAVAAPAGLVHARARAVGRRCQRRLPGHARARLGRAARRRPIIWAIPASHRLFLAPRQLRPRLVVKGSGIDWLAVSAEWEQEGHEAHRRRFAAACRRPPAGSSNCPTPAGWSWTRTRCNRRTKRWPTWASMAWCRWRSASGWSRWRTWMRKA